MSEEKAGTWPFNTPSGKNADDDKKQSRLINKLKKSPDLLTDSGLFLSLSYTSNLTIKPHYGFIKRCRCFKDI